MTLSVKGLCHPQTGRGGCMGVTLVTGDDRGSVNGEAWSQESCHAQIL